MIDFSQLTSGDVDAPYRDPDVPAVLGLVVARPADHGDDLKSEEQIFLETDSIPFIAFVCDDENGAEVFAEDAVGGMGASDRTRPQTQARMFADAMNCAPGILPSVADALEWSSATVAEVQAGAIGRRKP
jgi:hypothetical protein